MAHTIRAEARRAESLAEESSVRGRRKPVPRRALVWTGRMNETTRELRMRTDLLLDGQSLVYRA